MTDDDTQLAALVLTLGWLWFFGALAIGGWR